MREKFTPPMEKSQTPEGLDLDSQKEAEMNEITPEEIRNSQETLIKDLEIETKDKTKEEVAEEVTDKITEGNSGILKKLNTGKARKALKTLILGAGLLAASTGLEGYLQRAEAATPEGQKTEQTYDEKERHQLRELQNYAMEYMQKKEEEFISKGNKLTDQILEKSYDFQNKLWKMADFVVKEGGGIEDYKKMVDRLYQDEFARFLEERPGQSGKEKEEEKIEQKSYELGDLINGELPEGQGISEEWAWQNEGKVFKQGDILIVIKSAISSDYQFSIDKAALEGRGTLAEVLSKLKNQISEKEEDVKGGEKKAVEFNQTLYGSKKIFQKAKKENGKYISIVVLGVELSKNIK